MTLNDIGAVRSAFDRLDRARILTKLGPSKVRGLLVWHFGVDFESHEPHEIPVRKVLHFVRRYA